MIARTSRSLRATLALGLLALAPACGDGKPADRTAAERPLPSVARDVPGHASVAPRPTPPLGVADPEATPVTKPVAQPTKPAPKVALGFDGHIDEGKKLYDAGDYREALLHFEQAAVIKPKNAGARVHLARTLLVLGEKREARKYVEQALELAPTSSAGWSTLGRIELADNDLEAALSSFRRATEEDAESSHAWNNLGYTLMAQGQYEDAAAALENATAGAAPTAYMWNNLGMAYEHVDRIREARAAYRQAAGLGSGKGEANMARLEGVRSLVPADDAVAVTGTPDRKVEETIVTP